METECNICKKTIGCVNNIKVSVFNFVDNVFGKIEYECICPDCLAAIANFNLRLHDYLEYTINIKQEDVALNKKIMQAEYQMEDYNESKDS